MYPPETKPDAECSCCQSISGVYYDLCDDCMTRLNKHDRLRRYVNEFFGLLDLVEESESGREFYPVFITSCRTLLNDKLDRVLQGMRESV